MSFPGHFLIKLRMPQGEVVIDPFTGQSLSREELDDVVAYLLRYKDERFEALPAGEQRGLRARAAQWLAEQRMF